MRDKGPTRVQLQGRIDRLEQQNEMLRMRLKPDPLRRPGEHWYEVVAYFDASGIQKLPTKPEDGRAFIMPGMINGMTIVEVSKHYARTEDLEKWLSGQLGVNPLVITDDVRFVKLATVSPEMEAELDAGSMEKTDGEEEKILPTGTGSELPGDGLGSGGSGDDGDCRGGSDSHAESEGERTTTCGGG